MKAQTVEPLRLVGVRGLLILGGVLTANECVIHSSSPSPTTSSSAEPGRLM